MKIQCKCKINGEHVYGDIIQIDTTTFEDNTWTTICHIVTEDGRLIQVFPNQIEINMEGFFKHG